MVPRTLTLLAAAILATNSLAATAGEITGPAQVVDGGTIVIARQRLLLDGLDAPPLDRLCPRDGETWRCGEAAAFALAAIIERHWLTCQTPPHRVTCRMGGPKGIDVGRALVRGGWAKARAGGGYERDERDARRSRRGLWATR